MATIYKRPKKDGSFTYWTKFRRDGKLIRTNTGTDNKVKAQQFLRAQQNRIDEGIAPTVDAHKVTYVQIRDNLVKDYETYETRNARAPQVAQTISGHKSASVFARYNIISKADRADAIKKLESFHRNGGAA